MERRSRAFRPAVLAKDNRTCQATWLCRRKGPRPDSELEADHIVPRWKEGPDTVENGQTLCKKHHKAKSAREAAQRAKKRDVSRVAQVLVVAVYLWAVFCVGSFVVRRVMGWDQRGTVEAIVWGIFVLFALAVVRVAVRHRGASRSRKPRAEQKRTGLDFDRVVAVTREVMGSRGEVVAYAGNSCDVIVSYEGTGFADGNHEKRLELLERLADKMGGRWQGEWQTEQDEVWLSRIEGLSSYVPHPGFSKRGMWNIIPIADNVAFDLRKTSHLLICGLTNSGKTGLLHSIIAHLSWWVRMGSIERLFLLDPKRVELTGWRGMPGIEDVFTSGASMWDAVNAFTAEMDRRYKLHEEWERSDRTEGQPLSSHKPWVMLVDEYEEWLTMMQAHADEEVSPGKVREKTLQKRPATPVQNMARLARLARKAKMHLIVATQRGDAELIGGRVRNNFGGRVLVGRGGAAESLMCFGDSSWGRQTPAIFGRMTVQTGEARPREVQGFYFPDPGAETHSEEDARIATLAGLDLS